MHRHQGTHDSLCAYYAAAMMLCALRPEMDIAFEAASVAGDPLFANVPRRRGQSIADIAADWLTSGLGMPDLTKALNRACKGTTRFKYGTAGHGELCAHIDQGLPSVIGWESGEMGNHTSLVVGYDHYAGSRSRWLRLLDPIAAQDTVEWNQLTRLATAPIELIQCVAHAGRRPDKLTVMRDRDGNLLPGMKLERWNDGWA